MVAEEGRPAGLDEERIAAIVRKVVGRLSREPGGFAGRGDDATAEGHGTFDEVEAAVRAAEVAFRELGALSLDARGEIVAAMRRVGLDGAENLSALAVGETGIGRYDDKVQKHIAVARGTPGTEDLAPTAYSGDHGLTIMERAPWGVIGSITPVTNPSSTIICNAIGMVAAGNSVVFNPHPRARGVSVEAVRLLNEAVVDAGGPPNLLTTVREPTVDTAKEVMAHPVVQLIVVTGGQAVVREATRYQKRVIAAGPGNPPVVVDETADLDKAARGVVAGASFDNNIVCSDEKVVLAVTGIADQLKRLLKEHGAYELNSYQFDMLTKLVVRQEGVSGRPGEVNVDYVGRDAARLLGEIGISAPSDTRLITAETTLDHVLVWTEQLMPILPIVRVKDVDAAIDQAVQVERNQRHTAVMHSKNIEKLHRMACLVNTAIFVKNGPSYTGLGIGGEGYVSLTIAGPTGEGLTSAKHFSRERRCTLIDYFRIV